VIYKKKNEIDVYLAHMRKIRNLFSTLIEKPEEKLLLGSPKPI
jgi:hypothetical protein